MAGSAKKYKLTSAGAAGEGVCAFFFSPQGCRNGSSCKFLHEKPSAPKACVAADEASVVSSESEDEKVVVVAEKETKTKKENNSNKKKGKKRKVVEMSDDDDDDDIFCSGPSKPKEEKGKSPAAATTTTTPSKDTGKSPKAKKQKTVKTESLPVAPPPKKETPAKKATPKKPKKTPKAATPKGLAALNLPVAMPPAECIYNEPKTKKEPVETSSEEEEEEEESSEDEETEQQEKVPFPTHTETGKHWSKAILATREGQKYANDFDFDKAKALDANKGLATADDWFKCKPYGDWCKHLPQAIAIDCEMVETKCPKTGTIDPKALARLSVINAEKPEEVLLDTLVKPKWPVSDYRTWINGIEEKHLKNVKFTLEHAQQFMQALCSEETVVTGHAVFNDLISLRMEHQVNADSAYLFEVKDFPQATASLKDVVTACLDKEMPDTHDSVNDARMALLSLEVWNEKDGKVDPVIRTKKKRFPGRSNSNKQQRFVNGHQRTGDSVNENASNQLFVHRIPKFCKDTHLMKLFLKHTNINPISVDDIEMNGKTGKTLVEFSSLQHANLAFQELQGTAETDKSGRLQKKVYLKNGEYMRVRKMVHERRRSHGGNQKGQ